MAHDIPRQMLLYAAEQISSLMGLHFPESRLKDLERGIASASRDFGFIDPSAFIAWLTSTKLTKSHIETLACHLTVGETYFFREKESFDALEHHILPGILEKRGAEKRLRVWSAGCSTGEEPYSIAMLLSRISRGHEGLKIDILATDISPHALKKAAKGVYSEWSFRGTPQWVKDRYFTRTEDGLYEVCPEIRKMVFFEYLNLAEDAYPSLLNNTNAMDLIFCRNVLMYFSQEKAQTVISRLHNSLVDDGWLLLSPTEALKGLTRQFTVVNFTGTTFYKKGRHTDEQRPFAPIPAPSPEPVFEAAVKPEKLLTMEDVFPDTHRSAEVAIRQEPGPEPYKEALKLLGEGLYHEAAETLEPRADKDARSCALMARIYANQGKLEQAGAWCARAVSKDKLNPAYHYLLATVLLEQGETEKASGALKKSIYVDTGFVLAYFVLGNVCMRLGDTEGASRNFKNTLELLSGYRPEDILPESDGLTAGRMAELISSMAF